MCTLPFKFLTAMLNLISCLCTSSSLSALSLHGRETGKGRIHTVCICILLSYQRVKEESSRQLMSVWLFHIKKTQRRLHRLHPDGPADLATVWTRTGRPVRVPRDVALPVVLLPDRRNTRHRRTGTQLAAGPLQVCISPSEPSRTDTVQGQGGRGADPARGAILALPDLVPRADAPRDSPSLADYSEEGSTASETGHPVAPASRPLETSCLVPGRDAEFLGDLPQEGVYTITSARSLSTRHAYALKLNLFVEWCSSHGEDPGKCPIRVILSFLQQRLERRLSPSILKRLCGYDCCQPRPRGWEVGGEA